MKTLEEAKLGLIDELLKAVNPKSKLAKGALEMRRDIEDKMMVRRRLYPGSWRNG